MDDQDGYTFITKTVDEECCNPLKLWHDMGEIAYPVSEETELIRSSAYPLVKSEVLKAENGELYAEIDVKTNGVVYFELSKRNFTPDRGYDYDRVMTEA